MASLKKMVPLLSSAIFCYGFTDATVKAVDDKKLPAIREGAAPADFH